MLTLMPSHTQILCRLGRCRDALRPISGKEHSIRVHKLVHHGSGTITLSTTDGRRFASSTVSVAVDDGVSPFDCMVDAFGWDKFAPVTAAGATLTRTKKGISLAVEKEYESVIFNPPDTPLTERTTVLLKSRPTLTLRHQPKILWEDVAPTSAGNEVATIPVEPLYRALQFVLGHHDHSDRSVERDGGKGMVCTLFPDGMLMGAEMSLFRVARVSEVPNPLTLFRSDATYLLHWLSIIRKTVSTIQVGVDMTSRTPITCFKTECGQHHFCIRATLEREFSRDFVDRWIGGAVRDEVYIDVKSLAMAAKWLVNDARQLGLSLLAEGCRHTLKIESLRGGSTTAGASETIEVAVPRQYESGVALCVVNGHVLAKAAEAFVRSGIVSARLTIRDPGHKLVLQAKDEVDCDLSSVPLAIVPTMARRGELRVS